MSLIGSMVLAAVAGFGGHLTRPLAKQEFAEDGALPIVIPAIGVCIAFPFLLVFWDVFGGAEEDKPKLAAAFWAAFCSIGAGVMVGHFLIPDRKG